MQSFKFQAPTKVIFGSDTDNDLGAEIKVLNVQKVLIVTDEGIIAAGLLERVREALYATGFAFEDFFVILYTYTFMRI